MDVTRLRKAHDDFLAVAAAGGFGPPPADEPRPLRSLLTGLGEVHLPAHAEQLRGLRR
jgi:hypothetical protein